MRKWIINVGYFIILNLIFLIVDGKPPIIDLEFGNLGNKVLQTNLFTNWFNFYETQFFNIVLFFAMLHLILTGLYDVVFKTRTK
ncbi:YfzA family protein [Lysinibacillus sp. CTST325]